MTNSVDMRAHIVDVFRRDLIGPGPQDADLANERLNESPARWYLAGFLAPAEDPLALDGDDDESDPSAQEEMEIDVEEPDADGVGGAATDNEEPEAPNARRRFLAVVGWADGAARSGRHVDRSPRLLGRLSNRTATA